ncbi:MAG: MHYT domain-containing protein, partial [Nitrososphaera sp.]
MGFAIAGMHYTGMAGTVFTPTAMEASGFSLDPTVLSVSIGTVGICILIIALIVTTAKYLFSLVQQEKEFLGAILKKVGIHFTQVTPRCSMGRWTMDIDLNLALTTHGHFKSSRRGSP